MENKSPTIISIGGCMCSGKSYICSHFKDVPEIGIWDITEWYKENKIIDKDGFNWDLWREKEAESWKAFEDFILKCEKENKLIVLLETSGTNKRFNENLEGLNNKVIKAYLKVPSKEQLIENAKKREDVTVEHVLSFRDKYEIIAPVLYDDELIVEVVISKINKYLEKVKKDNND